MFNRIKTPAKQSFTYKRNSHSSSAFGKLYERIMDSGAIIDYARGPECRPSSFPQCSVRTLMRLAQGAHLGFFQEEQTSAGVYFTTAGTAIHEALQYRMGDSGQIWGDWTCRNPTCQRRHDARTLYDEQGNVTREGILTRENTVNNKCPTCKHPMDYVEKEINYRGVKGHVDCIMKLKGGGWWVADYKTCTKNKIDKASTLLPERAHMAQVPTYCFALEEEYGIKVYGFSILYLSRDNPFLFYEHAEAWTDQWRKDTKEMIADQVRMFKASLISLYRNDPKQAVKHKPCPSLKHYNEKQAGYTPCPYLDQCFKPGFTEYLVGQLSELKYTKKAAVKLIARQPATLLPKQLRSIK